MAMEILYVFMVILGYVGFGVVVYLIARVGEGVWRRYQAAAHRRAIEKIARIKRRSSMERRVAQRKGVKSNG